MNESSFFPLFNESSDNEFTVFAPTDAAFAAQRDEFEDIDSDTLIDADTLVGHHIIDEKLRDIDLVFDKRFQTLSNTTVHTTTVVFADRSLYQFNPQYSSNNHPSSLIRYTNVSLFLFFVVVVIIFFWGGGGGETVLMQYSLPAS